MPQSPRFVSSPTIRSGAPKSGKKRGKLSITTILGSVLFVVACLQGVALFSYFQSYHEPENTASSTGLNGEVKQNLKKPAIKTPILYKLEEPFSKPEFDKDSLEKQINEVKDKYSATAVTSCRQMDCTASGLKIVVYNPMEKQRYLCGTTIPRQSSTPLEGGYCHERSRMFRQEPQVPPESGSLLIEPISICQGENRKVGSPKRYSCNVPCEYYGGVGIKNYLHVLDTKWEFIYSMEGSGYYHDLRIDPTKYQHDQFYATTSFKSDIPLPYFSWAEYNIETPPVDYDKVIAGASFMAGNCNSNNGREHVVESLQKAIRVDSIGKCLHNAAPPNGVPQSNKAKVQQQYLFHLAFENTNEEDYITEKLWGTLSSGTLPVYMGSPNVKDHAPPNSIISLHDFRNSEELGKYLQEVAKNKTLYNSYHEWRKHPLPKVFTKKYDFTHTHSICRMCRWAYAKKTGFGWDHSTQKVQDTRMRRKLCVGKDGMIGYPFVEILGGEVATELPSDCSPIAKIVTHAVAGWKRDVEFHDGIIDITITGSGKEGEAYRIATKPQFEAKLQSANHYRLSDQETRIDILSSWEHSLRSPEPGVMDVILVNKDATKIRVILQDIDTFHSGAHDVEYSYGSLMMEDFAKPLEFFAVEGGKFPTR